MFFRIFDLNFGWITGKVDLITILGEIKRVGNIGYNEDVLSSRLLNLNLGDHFRFRSYLIVRVPETVLE